MPTDTVPMPIPDNGSILVNRDEISLGHSDEAMREYAAQVAAAENYGLLSLLYDIRVAAGDKEGRLMQSELVELIARQREECEQMRAAYASGRGPIAWECTGQGLKKYVTDKQYQAFTPGVRKWYKPYRCTNCKASQSDQR